MSDRNRIPDFFEEAEDALFQKLIDRQEGASALEETNPNHSEPSEEEIAAFRRKLDKLSSEDPPLHPTPAKGTKLRRMILVAAIIIVLLVTAAAAFHKEVFNWIEKTHERFTLFQAVDQTENTIRTWMGYYAPTALPEEYFVSDAVEGETARIIEYANANNDRILFYQYTSEAYFTLDTEDATASQPCQLGEITARHFDCGTISDPRIGAKGTPCHEIAAYIRAIGVKRTILSSDYGQLKFGNCIEGMGNYLQALLLEGFSADELHLMSSHNPAELLSLD